MFTIYALYDVALPGDIRYVGKTVNIRRRVAAHVEGARRSQRTHKERWIAAVLRAGSQISHVVLADRTTLQEAYETEQAFITQYRLAGAELT